MEMVMPYREFTVPKSTEPVGFSLEGERFMCRPQIAAGILLKFGALMGAQEDASSPGQGRNMLEAVMGFFKAAIMQPGYDKFLAMLNDPELAIPITTLIEIAQYLGEVYSGERPTGESLPESSSKLSTGDDSTVGVSVETPTYSRSPEIVPTT